MKLKTFTHEGVDYAVIQDGKPVYIGDDGKEIAFDAVGTRDTITRLNGEAKGHREGKEAAETKLKAFEGIDDPAKAKAALQTVANLDQKKLIDAGEVEKVKEEAIKAVRAEFEPVVTERDALKGQLNGAIKGNAFANSKFVADKVAVPRHMLEKTYGENFKVEEGKLVPYDAAGNKIYSRAKPGEVADFEEAIEHLVNADPFKDHILKGQMGQGGGAGDSKGDAGAKTMSRKAFEALSPMDQMAKTREAGFTLTDD